MKKRYLGCIIAAALVLDLTGCGYRAEIEDSDEIPSMTEVRGFSYLETDTERTPTQSSEKTEESLPDMTGTDLATTYTDEYGNIYGISETEPTEINSDNTLPYYSESTTSQTENDDSSLSRFPDIGIDEYYRNTDPGNTVISYDLTRPDTYTTAPFYTTTAPAMPETVTITSAQTTTTAATTTAAPENTKTSAKELAQSRRVQIPSKYTSHNEIMHTNSYNSLTDKQKYAYDAITAAALSYEESVSFELSDGITFDDMYTAYQTLYLDEVRLFYIDTEILYNLDYATSYVTDMDISYLYTKEQTQSMQKEIDTRTDEILSQITPEMTDYEIVKLIHDEIIKSCTYTLVGNSSYITSIYGTLARNEAQCQGYARTFSYLCNLCGIETDIALGVANEEHMWNMVKINGKWYHIDLTWDDPDKTEFPDFIRYDYFCVTTDRMLELRTIEGNSHTLPEANSDDLEYYNYNGLVVDSVEEARELFHKEAVRISEEKGSTVQFRCSTSEVYEEVMSEFFNNSSQQNVIYMTDEVNKDPAVTNKFRSDEIYHQGNYDTLIIKVMMNYTQETENSETAA